MPELFRLMLLPFGRASRTAFLVGCISVAVVMPTISSMLTVAALKAPSAAIGYLS